MSLPSSYSSSSSSTSSPSLLLRCRCRRLLRLRLLRCRLIRGLRLRIFLSFEEADFSTYVFIWYTFVQKTQQAVYTKKIVAFRSNLRNELSWDSRRWYNLQPAEIEIFFYLVVNAERLLREHNFSDPSITTSRGALGKEQSWNERVEPSWGKKKLAVVANIRNEKTHSLKLFT